MGEATLVEKPPSYSGFGRPSQLSYELINRVAARVQAGNYPLTAARAEGIAERTWLRWTERGQADDATDTPSIYAHLWQVLDQKEAVGETELLEQAVKRKVGWQGPMTVLSRRHRGRWEDKQALAAGLVIQIGVKDSDVSIALSPTVTRELAEKSTG